MSANRTSTLVAMLLCGMSALSGCGEQSDGPIRVVAIGGPPVLADPSRAPVSAATELLLESVAQGLVRFDATGEIEPALAQSWIVSDDGLRYTFRLRQSQWARGEAVTAPQVVERIRAMLARPSRNPLKPVLGVIDEVEAMTDRVLELRLKAPRPNLLQLLAQPEMAIIGSGQGGGPYRLAGDAGGALRLAGPPSEDDPEPAEERAPEILLRGETVAQALVRFAQGEADLVTGGTLGDLPVLAAADVPDGQVAVDPTRGLFGLAFVHGDGLLGQASFRQALSMAIDRDAMLARFGMPGLQARTSIIPGGTAEIPQPAAPNWVALPLTARREQAAQMVAALAKGQHLRLRVALPEGLGYRIVFAHLRRDWRMIGVDAAAVPASAAADLRLIDEVAPADLATWYLRHFLCDANPICDATASLFIEGARLSPTAAQRQTLLQGADRALSTVTPFIPIGSPLRWSLRSPRLNGFRTNVFGRHALTELVQNAE